MKNLLVVGGTGRNVGKTEWVCQLIKRISLEAEVYALKVSSIFPDEQIYHGDHSAAQQSGALVEESRRDIGKDTSRMLRAGARRVFYLQSDDSTIAADFAEFLSNVPTNSLIICESNSLALVVEPAVHIVVTVPGKEIKARAVPLMARADLLIVSDGQSGFPELEKIAVKDGNSWILLSSVV